MNIAESKKRRLVCAHVGEEVTGAGWGRNKFYFTKDRTKDGRGERKRRMDGRFGRRSEEGKEIFERQRIARRNSRL